MKEGSNGTMNRNKIVTFIMAGSILVNLVSLFDETSILERAYLRNKFAPKVELETSKLHGISALRAIVTGLEFSGTSIVSNILFNAPCVIGATETGLLLAKTPSEIRNLEPWFDFHQDGNRDLDYKLAPNDIKAMTMAKDLSELLDILRSKSHMFNNLNDAAYCQKPYQMIDRTPLYVYPKHFEDILSRTPGVPVIVVKKPFDDMRKSYKNRNLHLDQGFYNMVYGNVEEMMKKYPDRIILLDYEKFWSNPKPVMQSLFNELDLLWDPDFLNMVGLKKKFSNYPKLSTHLDKLKFQPKKKIVGFWHIGENYYPSEETRDHFVMKQANELLDTYMFNEGIRIEKYDLRLNYVTKVKLSEETKTFLAGTGLIHETLPTALETEDGIEYFEYPTLMELYSFCKEPENRDTTVFYIHSKTEDHKRQHYQKYMLGDSCLRCLEEEGKTACGVTYKGTNGFPWAHFSGNFWMTDCAYISTLNAPWYPEILEEVHIPDSEMPWMAHPPYGRFFAEYWMMNDIGPRPEHVRGAGLSRPHLEQKDICSDSYQYSYPR